MKKFLAVFLVAVLTIGLMPSMVGYTDKENASVSVGEWLSLIDSEFGMTYYEQSTPYFENVPADNIYFGAVQTAVEWDVISADDVIDVFSAVTTDFMAATLVKAAKLTGGAAAIANASKLYNPGAVEIAAGNGIVPLDKNGALDNRKITLAEGQAALAVAKNLWATRAFSNDEALVKTTENLCDLSDLPVEEGKPAYTVEKTDTAKEIITLPATIQTAALTTGSVVVLPASPENPFGAVRTVTEIEAANENAVTVACEPAEIDEVFEEINLETDFAPDFNTAQVTDENGEVLNEADYKAAEGFSLSDSGIATAAASDNVMMSLLRNEDAAKAMQCASYSGKPIDINLAVGDYAVSGKIDGDKMDFSVSAVINGVKITKTYNFSNFNLSTKADVSVIRAKIKEAYIRVDYDVVDTTTVEGNYNTSLADYNWGKEAALSDVDNALGTNILDSLQGAADKVAATVNNIIPIASIEIPIPNMPIVSISLDISLRVNIDGSIELVVETNNARGYEIINNQGRVINNTVNKQNTVNLGADCQLTANFGMALKLIGLTVVDAGLETGIGVDAQTSITWFTAQAEPGETVTADVPLEVALTLTAGETYYNVTGDITIYGILKVSVGQNSKILQAIGLAKTWDIFNKDNAVIYAYHFDEGNIPVPASSAEASAEETTVTVAAPEAPAAQADEVAQSITLEAGQTLSLADKGSAWASSDSAVAAIAEDGTLMAVAAGAAVVTGTDDAGQAVSVSITVTEAETTDPVVVVVSAFRATPAYRAV